MDYHNKYLKYKKKYTSLKSNMIVGGHYTDANTSDTTTRPFTEDTFDPRYYTHKYNEYKKQLKSYTDKPRVFGESTLVGIAMTGLKKMGKSLGIESKEVQKINAEINSLKKDYIKLKILYTNTYIKWERYDKKTGELLLNNTELKDTKLKDTKLEETKLEEIEVKDTKLEETELEETDDTLHFTVKEIPQIRLLENVEFKNIFDSLILKYITKNDIIYKYKDVDHLEPKMLNDMLNDILTDILTDYDIIKYIQKKSAERNTINNEDPFHSYWFNIENYTLPSYYDIFEQEPPQEIVIEFLKGEEFKNSFGGASKIYTYFNNKFVEISENMEGTYLFNFKLKKEHDPYITVKQSFYYDVIIKSNIVLEQNKLLMGWQPNFFILSEYFIKLHENNNKNTAPVMKFRLNKQQYSPSNKRLYPPLKREISLFDYQILLNIYRTRYYKTGVLDFELKKII